MGTDQWRAKVELGAAPVEGTDFGTVARGQQPMVKMACSASRIKSLSIARNREYPGHRYRHFSHIYIYIYIYIYILYIYIYILVVLYNGGDGVRFLSVTTTTPLP